MVTRRPSKRRGYREAKQQKKGVVIYTERRGYREAKQKKRRGYIHRGQAKGVVTKRPSERCG